MNGGKNTTSKIQRPEGQPVTVWGHGFNKYHTQHTKPNGALWAKAKEDTIAEEKTEKGTTDLCQRVPGQTALLLGNVLWTDETKIELFGNAHQQFVTRRRNEAYKEKNTLPTVKHGGGSIILWGLLCCIWYWSP